MTDSGKYEEWVFQSNTTGTLDFVYQFSVSQGAVEQMTGAVYDCSVVTGLTSFGSGGSPTGGNCNSASQTADFQFGNTMGPGTMSQYLEVATRATSYGSIEFQDGANGYAQGFAPVTTAPEPGSLALIGIGFLRSFGVFRRKRPI